jgi:hypothetical protein
VIQAPDSNDEDRDGAFEHGGCTLRCWHDDIGRTFGALMQDVDALLLGRRTSVTHAQTFEPMPPGDPFGDMMNVPKKYVVSRTLRGRRPKDIFDCFQIRHPVHGIGFEITAFRPLIPCIQVEDAPRRLILIEIDLHLVQRRLER